MIEAPTRAGAPAQRVAAVDLTGRFALMLLSTFSNQDP
jgi:hypothetical protein